LDRGVLASGNNKGDHKGSGKSPQRAQGKKDKASAGASFRKDGPGSGAKE